MVWDVTNVEYPLTYLTLMVHLSPNGPPAAKAGEFATNVDRKPK
jgi:hypothetical protein